MCHIISFAIPQVILIRLNKKTSYIINILATVCIANVCFLSSSLSMVWFQERHIFGNVERITLINLSEKEHRQYIPQQTTDRMCCKCCLGDYDLKYVHAYILHTFMGKEINQ